MSEKESARLRSPAARARDSAAARQRGRRAAVIKAVLLVVTLAVFTLAALLLPPPPLEEIRGLVAGAGWWGPVGFGTGYAALTLAPVPKNVLSIAAGVLFGFGPGLLVVYIAAMVGASAAFWLGRALGREAVERFTGTRVAKAEDVLDRHGFAAVVGVRLVPVLPFTVINYSAGLTSVGWWPYLLGTLIGIIPGTASYLALGAFGFESGAHAELALAVLGILTLTGVALAIRAHRRSPTTDV